MKTEELEKLLRFMPCEAGLEFVRKFDTLQDAWDTCANLTWLVWLIEQTDKENAEKNLRLIAADIAESVLHIFEEKYPDDKRPRQAIEVARQFACGNVTSDMASDAFAVTYAAAYATYAAAAADATYAAAAAYATDATYAAFAVTYAAADAADAATDKLRQVKLNCDIVRRYYPQVPI